MAWSRCGLGPLCFAALCVLTCEACNGDGSFCMLPFTKFTFPASHNAGSFNLNIPPLIKDDIPLVDVKDILRCFYNCHSMDYLQQLNFGMRWFWPDVCTRVSGKPDTFYDCHSSSGTDESAMGWGTVFSDNLQIMKDWLTVNPRELLVVATDNMHTKKMGTDRNDLWFSHFAEKFGSCVLVDNLTQPADLPSRATEAACIRLEGRMNENITMGDLIDRNLRVVVFPEQWRAWIHSTYSDVNAGAQREDLLQVFQDYADGKLPLEPNSLVSMQVIGAARAPDFSEVDMSKPNDPIWPVVSALSAVKQIDLRCVDAMATKHNTNLLQDDSHPYDYFTGKDCPGPCGCLGYQSPLEVVHQKLMDLGHHIQSVNNDYSDLGERQSIVHVTRRMNQANYRRFVSEAEPVRSWWDCNWPAVLGVAVPLTLVLCCSCYLTLVCVYPEKYGLWIRAAWERHQDALAQKRIGREQGREEARAYLRNANGLGNLASPEAGVEANPVIMGVTSVAPPPGVQVDNGGYKAKATE